MAWLVTRDGRAFNLDHYRWIEASGGNLTGHTGGEGPGQGSTTFGTDLSEDDVELVLSRLLKGEGADLRPHEGPFVS
jgi:hypothetical protein